MTEPAALARLEQLRRRARDTAQRRLVEARAAHAAFEQRRLGWRARIEAEAERAEDPTSLPRWLEGCRVRERALADEAARLAAAVAEAERAYRDARLAVEQIETLRAHAREAERREALRREQRWLDDLGPMKPR